MRGSMRALNFVRFVLFAGAVFVVAESQSGGQSAQSENEQLAVAQLRAIVNGIKKCPSSRITFNDGGAEDTSAPINVVWDSKPQESYRSKRMGFIEYVQRSSYVSAPLNPCKKKDQVCLKKNDVIREVAADMDAIPYPDHFRLEFDFLPNGLEFNRALKKRETEDATHWVAMSFAKGCEVEAVQTILNQSK